MPGRRFSPAAAQRARKADQAHDRARAEAGNDANRRSADREVPDDLGDQRLNHPGVNNRRVGR